MIEVTTDTSAFDSSLRQLQKRMGDLRQPLSEVGGILENKIRDRRETRSDPNGRAWADWSDSYRASYNVRRGDEDPPRGKILERSGAMWDKPGGPQWEVSGLISSPLLRVGFDMPYSTHHEFGTRTMPRRGLLYADPDSGKLAGEDEDAINDELERWLTDTLE